MKKFLSFLLVISALIFVSCKKEAPVEEAQQLLLSISVERENPETKTIVGSDLYTPLWHNDDEIWFSDGVNQTILPVSRGDLRNNGTLVIFKKLPGLAYTGELYAVYPASTNPSIEVLTTGENAGEKVLHFDIPSQQSGTFGEANICVAKSIYNPDIELRSINVCLKNATSVFRFERSDPNITEKVKFVLEPGGDALCGTQTVRFPLLQTPQNPQTSNFLSVTSNSDPSNMVITMEVTPDDDSYTTPSYDFKYHYMAAAPIRVAGGTAQFEYYDENSALLDTKAITRDNDFQFNYLYHAGKILMGELPIYYSVSSEKKVVLAPGNLKWVKVGGMTGGGYYCFNDNQYDNYSATEINNSGSTRDKFYWSVEFKDWSENKVWPIYSPYPIYSTYKWTALTYDEWAYLFKRDNGNGNRIGLGQIVVSKGSEDKKDIRYGLFILPDLFVDPELNDNTANGGNFIPTAREYADYEKNIYSLANWEKMEKLGVIFLPSTGYAAGPQIFDNPISVVNPNPNHGFYWTPEEGQVPELNRFGCFLFGPAQDAQYDNNGMWMNIRLARVYTEQ